MSLEECLHVMALTEEIEDLNVFLSVINHVQLPAVQVTVTMRDLEECMEIRHTRNLQ